MLLVHEKYAGKYDKNESQTVCKRKLKISDVESHLLTACHRLSPEGNLAITEFFWLKIEPLEHLSHLLYLQYH